MYRERFKVNTRNRPRYTVVSGTPGYNVRPMLIRPYRLLLVSLRRHTEWKGRIIVYLTALTRCCRLAPLLWGRQPCSLTDLIRSSQANGHCIVTSHAGNALIRLVCHHSPPPPSAATLLLTCPSILSLSVSYVLFGAMQP
jgi:hypothetical protein